MPKRKARLTKEQASLILNDRAKFKKYLDDPHNDNKTQVAMSKELFTTLNIFRNRCKKYGLTPKHVGSFYLLPDNEPERQLYLQKHRNKTNVELAHNMGVSAQTIKKWRMKYNIQRTETQRVSQHKKNQKRKDVKEMIKAHPEYTIQEIADELDSNYTTIQQIIRSNNLKYEDKSHMNTFDRNMDPDEIQKYIHLHPDYSIKQLAEHYAVGETTISDYIKRHDLTYFKNNKLNKLNVEDVTQFIKRYPNLYQKDWAKHFGVDPTTLLRFCKKHGIKYKKNYTRQPSVNKYQITDLLDQNPKMTQHEIAKKLAVTPSTISRLFKKYKIQRPQQ